MAAIVAVMTATIAASLIFTGALAVNTDKARSWLVRRINSGLAGHLAVGEHRLSLPGRSLDISGLHLFTAGGEEVISCDRLRLKIAWPSLWQRQLKIKTVSLENITARLLTEPNGKLNLVNALSAEKQIRESPARPENVSSGLFPLRTVAVEYVLIRDIHITHQTADGPIEACCPALSLSGEVGLDGQSGRAEVRGDDILLNTPAFSLSLQSLGMKATLDHGHIDPLLIEAKTPFGSVSINGQARQAFTSPALNLAVTSTADLAGVKELLNFGHDLSGRADLTATVTVGIEDPVIHADLKCQEAVVGPVVVDVLACTLDGSGQAMAIDVQADVPGSGEVKARGNFALAEVFPTGLFGNERNFDKLGYEASVNGERVDLRQLLNISHPLKGVVGARLKIFGRGVFPDRLTADFSGEIEIADFRHDGLTALVPLVIEMGGHCEQGVIQAEKLSARAAGLDMTGRGRYEIATNNVAGQVKLRADEISGLAALAGYENVSGSLELDAAMSGKFPEATAEAFVRSSRLTIGPVTVGDVDSRLVLSQDRLAVHNLEVHQRDSHCRAEGAIILADEQTGLPAADPAVNLTIARSHINLEDFVADGMKGSVLFSGDVAGTLRNPAGKIELQANGLDIKVMKADQVNATATLVGDMIEVDALEASFPNNERLRGSGALSLGEKAYRFEAVSEGLSLHQVRFLNDSGLVDGTARFSVSGRGAWWEIPSFDGDMHINRLIIAGQALDNMAADIKFNDNLIDVSVHGDLAAAGTLNLADRSFSITGNPEQFLLAPWFALAGRSDMGGKLTGSLEASGRLTDISTMTASADIGQVVLSHNQRDWITSRPFHLDYHEGVLDIPGIQLAVAEEGTVNIIGCLGVDGTVALDIDANAPMAMAEMYVPEIQDMTGRLAMDARVSGTLNSPVVTGTMELAGVGLSLPEMAHKLHDINGSIRFQPGEVAIEEIEGSLETGRFRIAGGASLDGLLPVVMDVRLQAASLPVAVPEVMELKLDADLAFVRDSGQAVVRGEVMLLDGVYYQDVQLAGYSDIIRAPFVKKRAIPPAIESRLPPFFKELSLDVAVKHRLPFKIDNNIALMEVQPDIVIKGSVNDPVLLGQARVYSGEVLFQRTAFLVERGVVSFVNPYKTEPYIDIEAGASIKQWRINLKATGTPEQLEVNLTSVPHEEQGDILSLLIFGKPSREMNAASGAAQPPAQMLAAFLAETVADDIKTITGLDIVEISASENSEDEETGQGRITLGSRVSERLTFKYSIKSGQDGVIQESVSDYRLTENATVSGFQDNRGVFGGRLIYRLEFR